MTTAIVGASIAGVRAAQALRAEGYRGDVVLIGSEPVLPYDKPPLSKGYLVGAGAAEVTLLTAAGALERNSDLRLGVPAVGLDRALSELRLANGRRVGFDDLVVATGVRARPSPWGEGEGIHVLRTLDDADRLRAELVPDRRIIVIGAGFIGAEVAATALGLGVDVTLVSATRDLMSRRLGDEIGALFSQKHSRHGVHAVLGRTVAQIDGAKGDFRVLLDDGSELHGDVVVIGIGAVPNVEWLEDSGLEIDDGLVCDEFLTALGAPEIHAIGDVARWRHPVRGDLTRLEHWTNAVDQARCVAHNIAHPDDRRSYLPVEYVWSDQFNWKLHIVGRTTAVNPEMVTDPRTPDRIASLYSQNGLSFDGAVVLNWPRALVEVRRSIAAGSSLSDVRVRLGRLLESASG